MNPYWSFYGALAAYGVFMGSNLVAGFRASRTPILDFCWRHAASAPLVGVFLGAIAWSGGVETFAAVRGAVIALVYFFLIHYGVGLQLFAVAQRSVSTNLLVSLRKSPQPLNLAELQRSYGGGRSIDCVPESRLAQMLKWGWIRASGDRLEVSPKGRVRAAISGFVLRVLSLRPLGDSPQSPPQSPPQRESR